MSVCFYSYIQMMIGKTLIKNNSRSRYTTKYNRYTNRQGTQRVVHVHNPNHGGRSHVRPHPRESFFGRRRDVLWAERRAYKQYAEVTAIISRRRTVKSVLRQVRNVQQEKKTHTMAAKVSTTSLRIILFIYIYIQQFQYLCNINCNEKLFI